MHDENGRLLAVMSNPLLRRKLSIDVMQQHIFHLAIGQIGRRRLARRIRNRLAIRPTLGRFNHSGPTA